MLAATERIMRSEAVVEELKEQSHDLFTRKSELVNRFSPRYMHTVFFFNLYFVLRPTGASSACHRLCSCISGVRQRSEPRHRGQPSTKLTQLNVASLERHNQSFEVGGL